LKVRISVSIDENLLNRLKAMIQDESSPFYGNLSHCIEYHLRRGLPLKADISVELESRRR